MDRAEANGEFATPGPRHISISHSYARGGDSSHTSRVLSFGR